MTALYANLAKTAAKLLARFGQKMTLTRRVLGTYSVATSGVSASTVTTHEVIGVVADYKVSTSDNRQNQTLQSGVNATIIQNSEKQVLLSSAGFEPKLTDMLAIGSVNHAILHIERINPGGTTLLYKLKVQAAS